MKLFRKRYGADHRQRGFSLVEATLSIGFFSFAFLTLTPLLVLGLKSARMARDNRIAGQIAQTLVEEAKQGALPATPEYLDGQGSPCAVTAAIYTVTTRTVSQNSSLSQLLLKITPTGAPDRVRTYAILFSPPP
jgi:type II secretory pathway pseudopilin PulG